MKKFKILSKIILTISILFFVSVAFAQTQSIRTGIVNSYETVSNSENRSVISYSFSRNESPELPIDFETATSWGNFDGGDLTTVVNPDSDGNSSANVGKMVKNAGQTWGGSLLTLSESIDFATKDTFTMKVWSPRVGTKVLLKVENSNNTAISFETTVATTVANQWETLTFDFIPVNYYESYDQIVVIFDNGTMGDGSDDFTFYIDDIELSGERVVYAEGENPPYTVQDFYDVQRNSSDRYINVIYNDTDIDGDVLTLIDLETNGTGTISISENLSQVIYSPANDFVGEEIITYTISDGTGNTAVGTLVVSVISIGLPIDFEGPRLWGVQWGGSTSIRLENPDTNGNSSNFVGRFIKNNNAQGGFMLILDQFINLSDINSLTMKVWSPRVGVNIELSVEEENYENPQKVVVATTVENQWETLNFDFSNITNTYPHIGVQFDLGVPGDSSENSTFYIDDIEVSTNLLSNSAPIAIIDNQVALVNTLTNIDVIGNDSDINGDTLTITNVVTEGEGTVAVNSDGISVDYTSATDYIGTEIITYTISDGSLQANGTLIINTIPADSAPSENPPTPPVRDPEDVISIYSDEYTNVEIYDYDYNSDSESVNSYNPTATSSNTVLQYSNFNYQQTNFSRTDVSEMQYVHLDIWTSDAESIRFSPQNVGTGPSSAFVTIPLVLGEWTSVDIPRSDFIGMTWDDLSRLIFTQDVNSTDSLPTIFIDNIYFYKNSYEDGQNPPNAVSDSFDVDVNSDLVSIDVLANDTDADGDTLTLTAVSTEGSGTVALNSDGISVDYTPSADFVGQEIITYTVSDGTGNSTTGTLLVYMSYPAGANPPIANPDFIDIDQNSSMISVDVLANDYDVDGDTLTLTGVSTEGSGTVALNSDGVSVDYTVQTDFTGEEIVTYTISDGTGNSATGILVVTVNPIGAPGPTQNAPIPPTRDAGDVISVYSDVYSNINVLDFNPAWGQSGSVNSAYDPTGEGTNTVLEYSNFNYQGTDFDEINASAMEFVHIDIWTDNATDIKFSPINRGTGSSETLVNVPLVNGQWSSVDLPISDFTDMTWDRLYQLKFDGGAGESPSTVYIDNIYFYREPAIDGENPPVAVTDRVTMDQNAGMISVDVVANDTDADGDTLTLTGASTEGNGTVALNTDGVSVDYTAQTDFTGEEIVTYTISDGTGNSATGILVVNVYPIVASGPTQNAPIPPTRDAGDVISVYSDVYSNINVQDFNPNWGQSGSVNTAYDPTGEGTNTVLEYFNFNYQGTNFNEINASEMEFVHIDIWTENATDIKFSPINSGTGSSETLVNVPLVNGQWSSVDLPISDFTDMTWDLLYQIKFDGQGGANPSTIYLDNIYFYKNSYEDGQNPPNAVSDTYSVQANSGITIIDVLANDTDADGDTLTLTDVSTQGGGTVDINSNGISVDYTPEANFSGTEIVFYTVSDGTYTATGTLTVTIIPQTGGNNPIAASDSVTIDQNSSMISVDVVANDTDADGDTLTLTAVSTEGSGTVALNSDGVSVDYTVQTDFTGEEIVTYTISDGTGNSATGILVVTVNPIGASGPTQNAPIPPTRDAGNVISVYSDVYSNINVQDFNPNWGQSGSVNSAYDPTGEGTNTVLEYSNFNYQGTQFEGTIDASEMQFVHIDIWTENATDVKFTPINSIEEGVEESLVNVSLVNGQWSSVDLPISEFTDMSWNSLFQLKFEGTQNPSTIYIDNIYFWKTDTSSPSTTDDTLSVAEDSNLRRIDVTENDIANGGTLLLSELSYSGDGVVAINSDGVSVNYTPAADFNGIEIINYTVTNGTYSAIGILTVTVTPVSDAPVAIPDTYTVQEDSDLTSIDVIANDTDGDEDVLILTAVATEGDGTVAVNSDGLSVDYTPAADFNGTEIITYTVSDGDLEDTEGTLTITVTAVNDNLPVAVDDAFTVQEDADLTSIDVIANDTDADGDILTLTEVITDGSGVVVINSDSNLVDYTPAANFNGIEIITYTVSDGIDIALGTLTITVTSVSDAPVAVADSLTVDEDADLTGIDVIANDTDGDEDVLILTTVATDGNGTVVVNSDGLSVDYTPAADFNGTEIITYTVSDGDLEDATGILTITVTAVNDLPVAIADILTVSEDATITSKDVIANDTDVDADTLTLTAATTGGSGTISLNADGLSVDYTPAADFNGTEVITYTVSDGTDTTTGTLTITVTAVNDVPVTVADIATVIEDAALTSIDVVSNDTHGDGDTLTLISATTQGTGTVSVNADGLSVDYTPAANFNGTEIINYTVSDGIDTEIGTLTITVTAVNDAPVAVADAETVLEDATLTTIDIISNDTDVDGDTLTLLAATSDGNGIIEINADGLSVDYTPAANFNGTEIITYTVSDGELSDTTGTLTITVTTVKDPPVAVADSETVVEDANLTSIDVISNDTDSDGDTLILSSVTTNGTGTVTVNPNRLSVDYTPAADFNGTEVVTYVVSDRSFTATGTLTITVTPVNDAPVAVADIATVIEDATSTNIDVVSNDTHGDGDTLTLTAVFSDGNGIVTINENGLSVDYTPAADFNGTETITYTVSESEGEEIDETGTLTISVTSVNDLPTAVADELTVEEDAALTSKDVIENDTDIVEGDTLTLTAVVTDGNGIVAVNADGVSVDYTPASNFNGIETITYTVSDGTDTVTSTLIITVTEVNDAPVALADIATVVEDANLTSIDVINNDTDFDGDILTLTAVASDGNGIIEINEDGVSVDYTPASDFDGTEIITYTVFDGELSDTTGTLTITVTPVNDNLPIAVADVLEIDEDAALTSTNVIENDTDLDTQDTLTLSALTTDGPGTISINENGLSVDYIPAADFNGTEIITYSVSDGTDTDNSGTLTITVNPINDAPVANDDREIIPEDSSTQFFEVLSNDSDVDEDYLYITEFSTNGSGTVALNEDSERINYTPALGFKGTEIVTYTVTDGELEDTTGRLTIMVTNDAREITAITSNLSSQVETGSFEITATISSTTDVDIVIPFTTSGDAVNDIDYTIDFASQGEETAILNTGQDTYGRMTVTPNGKLVFYQNGQIKVYDPTTEILEEASFSQQMYWGSKVTGNTTMLGHYQSLLHKYDFSDINNITEELIFNGGNRGIEGYYQDGDAIYFGIENNGNRTLFKKVGNELTEIYEGNDIGLNHLFVYNNRVLIIENWNIYELKNPGPDSYFVRTRYRDNNNQEISLDNGEGKIFTYNNEIYVMYDEMPGKLSLPAAIQDNTYDVTFTPLPITSPTGNIQTAGFSTTGDLFTHNISYDEQGYSIYLVNSYRLSPVIKIAAGETTGNFTITGIDDDFYEFSESIIVSPGIPVNASYADALSSNGNATPLTLELSDDDEKADVTFAFSSPTIQEFPYETVTLTATLSAVSGVDVTVPFTLSANASTTVDVSATEILIAAGQTSGSVSISTTEAFDDSLVELQESITFSFDNTTIVNATTSVNDVALIVLSDDNPVITSIGSSGGIMTQDESGSFEITASVNLVSSKDVLIPITLSGDARYDEDYTATFASQGEKTTIFDLGTNSIGRMVALPDGNIVSINSSSFKFYDILENTTVERQLPSYLDQNEGLFAVSSTILYGRNYRNLYKIDISDIDNILMTPIVSFEGQNISFEQPFTLNGDTFVYQTYNHDAQNRYTYKKVGDADPELVYDENNCCYTPIMINDKIFHIWEDGISEIKDGSRLNDRYFNTFRINKQKLIFYNNEIYALNTNDDNKPGKLVITENQLTFEDLPIIEDSTIQYFDFDSLGNLITSNYEYVNGANSYSISSYQLLPQLKIPAGQTTGNFTITGIDDTLYELSESLVVSPGTAVNAIYSDALVTDGVVTPLTLELTDNDDLSEVTYAFSSPTIDENSATTVTLTASSESGAEITIPFTLTQDATSAVLGEEYIIVDDVRQIVIPANGNSASITISTTGLDDTDVEVQEPITFNFGTLVNATSEISDVTLNLLSDDNSVITAFGTTGDILSQDESGSFEVTASVDLPSSKDVLIPITLSGVARYVEDYTATFASQGEKTTIIDLGSNDSGKILVLPDGRLVSMANTQITIVDLSAGTKIVRPLNQYYEPNNGLYAASSSTLYVKANYGPIIKIDITDIDNITETEHISLPNNSWIDRPFDFDGETFLYQVYSGNDNSRKIFKKVGDADPELIWNNSDCCYAMKMINNKPHAIWEDGIFEIKDGGRFNERYFNNNGFRINYEKIVSHNNEIYSLNTNDNNKPGKLVITENQVTFEDLPITEDSTIQYFDFDSLGNLITLNYDYVNNANSYSISSYQLLPQLKIPAGQTTGNFTITGIDDTLYELSESLVVSPGTAVNATYSDALVTDGVVTPLTLELTDNDDLSEVTYAFSSPTIDENSATTVTLTASSESGAEITIPFTLTQDATSAVLGEEYIIVDDVRQIVIPANGNSASITISTTGLDDTDVEVQEPITFNFGTLVNATSEISDVTLNLLSDDNSVITAFGTTGDIQTQVEDGSFELIASVDLPSSKDVSIPLAFSGVAMLGEDYNVEFASKGEESTILDLGSNASGKMRTLPDGRIVLLNNNSLTIFNIEENTRIEKQLNRNYQEYYGFFAASNTVLYARWDQTIYKIDITDIDDIEETSLITTQGVDNQSFDRPFTFDGETFLYQIYDNGLNKRLLYKKVGDADPELLASYSDCCFNTVIINNKTFAIWDDGIAEMTENGRTGEHIRFNNNVRIDYSKIVFYNNEIYTLSTQNGNQSSNQPGKIILTDNELVFEPILISRSSSIQNFDFDSLGNLISLNSEIINGSSSYSFKSYQLIPQLDVLAGQTTGTISIVGEDDDLYELAESLVVSPGTAVNATYSDALVNNGVITPLTLELTDNDILSDVTFAFSSPTIDENSATTVTLTASSVSGAEITIPFTLSDDALSAVLGEEYIIVDDLRQIVIPANGNSGSITISTNGFDDTDVEVIEPITFNFGTILNATTQTSSISLNLISDDDPNFTGINVSKVEFAEHESTIVTANIDTPSSRDVSVALQFSGTATTGIDYFAEFDNLGAETKIYDMGTSSDGHMKVLPDGRLVYLNGGTLVVVNPEENTQRRIELSTYYWWDRGFEVISNTSLYAIANGGQDIIDIDISDIDNVTETTVVTLASNQQVEKLTFSEDTLVYIIYDSNAQNRKYFKKTGSAEVEMILEDNECCETPAIINNKIYLVRSWGIFELSDDGVRTNLPGNFNINQERLAVYNNTIYAMNRDQNNQVGKLVFPTNDQSPVTFEPLAISEDDTIQFINFNQTTGNLITQNYNYSNGTNNYSVSSYQLTPLITILAGETSGSLVVNGIEDNLNSPGEEENETVILEFFTPYRAVIAENELIEDITLTILNNEIDLVEDLDALVNVPALSFSSVAWGDYDRDGDQDMAIMGRGIQDGVITRIYENDNGVFIENSSLDPRYDGDLMWVDYNKDGYIDLIVSGLDNSDNPATTIYQNVQGTFVPSTDLILPNLFGSSMDSGDLDNDGDIDFVINGMEIVNGNNVWRKYIYLREGDSLVEEEDFNNQFESQYGVKNGSVTIADNQFDGDLDIIIVGESGSKSQINTYIKKSCQNWWECNYNRPTDLNFSSMTLFGDYVYYMGQTNQEEMKIYRRSLVTNQEQEIYGIDGLINGSIAIADYDNDGRPDMVLTGENENAESITKLYNGDGYSNFIVNTEVSLKGLRNSTAKWVDYDVDGDLDLFVSGTSDEGEFTKIYRTDLLNKNNTPSSKVSGLVVEDLGYGKIKLSWNAPNDDFSTSLGYVIRLATSSGGSEITNTESNLETGQRLITKSPVIYNTSYETLLDPGVYYWSVQSVDDGLKGSEFSEENTFQLTYEWKELNQGGIIDRSISSVNSPIVRLTDIDFDNDMDLIYGSRENDNDIQIFKLGTKKFLYKENLSNSRSISDIKFLDFNADKVQDVIINTWDKNSNQGSLRLYNTNNGQSYNNNIFQEVFTSDGLYQSKVELIDINNDGLKEVVHIGRTNAESNSQLKVRVYEQSNGTLDYNYTDISEQFGLLKSGAFAFGNADGDSDIDFAITGLTNSGIRSNLYVNQTESTAVINPVFSEAITEFPSAEDSTLDFFDYDSDGDLDIAITGQGVSGPMFKILSNNGMTGDELEYEEVLNTGLIPIREANLDFGDYNSDGYTDILYSGKVSGQGQVTKLVEFDPTTNSYVDSDFDLSDIINASIAFGDVDGDNDLDFAIAGESSTSGEPIIRTYLNLRDESAAVLEGTGIQTRNGEVEYVVNQRPTKPTGLETEILGYNGDSNTYQVKFSWTGATDESTPTEGLTYALKIGTTDQGDEIMSIKSLDNGYRISAGKGNVEHETSWIINLPDLPDNESYSWTVQSIDAAFSGSPLAESQTLDVDLIKLGDSDGNFVVDVLDLVTDVDYILGYDPSPFVFEAADVNNDETINVLDITATVDIILNPEDDNDGETTRNSSGGMNYYSSSSIGNAIFSWEGNDLFVESEFNVGGVQLTFDTDFEYVLSENLSAVQNLEFIKDDSKTLMLYSFDNTTIANSKTKLLTRIDSSKDLYKDQIIVGTVNGEKLNGLLRSSELESNEFNLLNLYPNPSSGTVNVEYYLPYQMDVVNVKIYDIQGRLVWTQELESTSGNIKNQLQLYSLRLGNYILSMNAYKDGILKHISHKRLILK